MTLSYAILCIPAANPATRASIGSIDLAIRTPPAAASGATKWRAGCVFSRFFALCLTLLIAELAPIPIWLMNCPLHGSLEPRGGDGARDGNLPEHSVPSGLFRTMPVL